MPLFALRSRSHQTGKSTRRQDALRFPTSSNAVTTWIYHSSVSTAARRKSGPQRSRNGGTRSLREVLGRPLGAAGLVAAKSANAGMKPGAFTPRVTPKKPIAQNQALDGTPLAPIANQRAKPANHAESQSKSGLSAPVSGSSLATSPTADPARIND